MASLATPLSTAIVVTATTVATTSASPSTGTFTSVAGATAAMGTFASAIATSGTSPIAIMGTAAALILASASLAPVAPASAVSGIPTTLVPTLVASTVASAPVSIARVSSMVTARTVAVLAICSGSTIAGGTIAVLTVRVAATLIPATAIATTALGGATSVVGPIPIRALLAIGLAAPVALATSAAIASMRVAITTPVLGTIPESSPTAIVMTTAIIASIAALAVIAATIAIVPTPIAAVATPSALASPVPIVMGAVPVVMGTPTRISVGSIPVGPIASVSTTPVRAGAIVAMALAPAPLVSIATILALARILPVAIVDIAPLVSRAIGSEFTRALAAALVALALILVLAPVALLPRTFVTRVLAHGFTGTIVDGAAEEALDHQGGVRSAWQLETNTDAEEAVLLIGSRRSHPQVLGIDQKRSELALQMEALQALDPHLIRNQPLLSQSFLEEVPVMPFGHLVQPGPGKREARTARQTFRRPLRIRHERAFLALQGNALSGAHARPHEIAYRAVPDVRLPRVEMNQLEASGNVIERAGEVAFVLRERLKDRVMRPEPARDIAAGAPIPPMGRKALLEAMMALVVAGILCREHREEGVLDVALHQVLDDPALTVGQVAETLIVEVVDRAVFAHDGDALAQTIEIGAREPPHVQLEGVATGELALERFGGEADGLDVQLLILNPNRPTAGNAHVLNRDPLPVLPAGEPDLCLSDAHLLGQDLGGLGAGQLAFGDAVDAIVAAFLEVAIDEELSNTKVPRSLFELHRGVRTFLS